MWHWAQIATVHSPRKAVTIMRADRDVPGGGDELATESSMRHPELETLDIWEVPIREVPKEGDASGRSLCDGSGRRFFRRLGRHRESARVIELGTEARPFISVSFGSRGRYSFV
jgi:hypothetical protein